MTNPKIVMLVGGSISSIIMYHQLSKEYTIEKVFIEKPASKGILIKRRLKRLGFIIVFGQLIFQLIFNPIIVFFSKKRKQYLLKEYNFDFSKIPSEKIINISSVNDSMTIQLLKEISPKVIVVNGTRIISKKVLQSTTAILINTHVGITPKYRGVHGGYWALVNKDLDHCGVTVHLIDEGIDTGDILYQGNIKPTRQDTFATYPIMQTAVGAELMAKAIKDALSDDLKPYKKDLESKLYYHPTAWAYLYNLIFKGVK